LLQKQQLKRGISAKMAVGEEEIMQRRLAAILFADVSGYGRLMVCHERDTHSQVMALARRSCAENPNIRPV
jgi:class 3 adenylate cyclase